MLAALSVVEQEQQLFFHGRGFSAILLWGWGLAAAVSGSGISVNVSLFGSLRGFDVIFAAFAMVFCCSCASYACVGSCLMVLRSEHFMVRRRL